MNILDFNYTKTDGKSSQRTFVEISPPNKNYFGIDISDLDTDEAVSFCRELEVARQVFSNAELALMQKYDIKHNYRNFDPTKMENIVVETE